MIDPHDMMCQELVEVLTEYLDATLGAARPRPPRGAPAVCDDCREYLAQFQATLASRAAPTRVTRASCATTLRHADARASRFRDDLG